MKTCSHNYESNKGKKRLVSRMMLSSHSRIPLDALSLSLHAHPSGSNTTCNMRMMMAPPSQHSPSPIRGSNSLLQSASIQASKLPSAHPSIMATELVQRYSKNSSDFQVRHLTPLLVSWPRTAMPKELNPCRVGRDPGHCRPTTNKIMKPQTTRGTRRQSKTLYFCPQG